MVSILGLAALAFLGDRIFLQGGSETASAPATENAKSSHEESKGAGVVAGGDSQVDASAATLAERLKRASDEAGDTKAGGNPFNPKWRGVVTAAAKPDSGKGSKPDVKIEATADGFAKTHPLTSVSGSVAMINKRPRKLGEDVDGWTLNEIDVKALSATLSRGTASVELHIRRVDPGAIVQKASEGEPESSGR